VGAGKLKLVLNTLLILAFLVVARDFMIYKKKSRVFESEVEELEEQIFQLRREADTLRERVRKLETDPATIEREVRNRFGMVAPGEEVLSDTETAPRAKR